ncbi:MAG: MFS transporter, partial [Thermodesulfobacteriota bacterium]
SLGYLTMTRLTGVGILLAGLAAAAGIRQPSAGSPQPTGGAPAPVDGTLSLSLWQSLKTRSFWLLWFTNAFVGAAGIAMVTLAIPFGTARGMDRADAVLLLMAFNITNGISRLVSGFFSDMIGRKRIMGSAFFLAGCAYFMFPHLKGPAALALPAAVVGFAFGTLFAVSAPFVSDCFGMAHFGSIFGLVFTAFGFFSGALGPWLSGYLLDSSGGNFTPVFLYLGGLMFVSSLLILIATPYTECKL